jgi:hypothetical protein
MKRRVEDDDSLNEAVRAFLEIGSNRNRLIHNDFGSFFLEKTAEEVYNLYSKAMVFVEAFPLALREFTPPATAHEERRGTSS